MRILPASVPDVHQPPVSGRYMWSQIIRKKPERDVSRVTLMADLVEPNHSSLRLLSSWCTQEQNTVSLANVPSSLGSTRDVCLVYASVSFSLFLASDFEYLPFLMLLICVHIFFLATPKSWPRESVRELARNIWDHLQEWGQVTLQGTVVHPGAHQGGEV